MVILEDDLHLKALMGKSFSVGLACWSNRAQAEAQDPALFDESRGAQQDFSIDQIASLPRSTRATNREQTHQTMHRESIAKITLERYLSHTRSVESDWPADWKPLDLSQIGFLLSLHRDSGSSVDFGKAGLKVGMNSPLHSC